MYLDNTKWVRENSTATYMLVCRRFPGKRKKGTVFMVPMDEIGLSVVELNYPGSQTKLTMALESRGFVRV